ncbi:hypothetical protein BJ875DRAFT_260976 [Amylocarpus encephaloides]|uniref:Mmc1 C-terminal domain-containing protein n=1 Tax=Amylocarpus encephaloides TaxID=45428 RepID=A0A9P8BYR0_9HELO|nr:hypothetical protein BJ875DRAFT_260976 [Amylocarpus encephaloides]
MPPRIPRVGIALSKITRSPIGIALESACPICAFSQVQGPRPNSSNPRRPAQLTRLKIDRRRHFTTTLSQQYSNSTRVVSNPARLELYDALSNVKKHAANYINISRLQLALRGLEQPTGEETIRVAIQGVADDLGGSLRLARQLVRVLLADPLKPEEEWERILLREPPANRPLFLHVGHGVGEKSGYSSRMVQELHVSSPTLNGHKLEILIVETGIPGNPTRSNGESNDVLEEIMVPTMEIPTSSTGRYTPVTTPVHKSLVVSQGILGISTLLSNEALTTARSDTIGLALDPSAKLREPLPVLPFRLFDIVTGTSALLSFRQSVDNALDYERKWFASGAPEILKWLKSGTSPTQGEMKLPVRRLIESVLESTKSAIQAEETRQAAAAFNAIVARPELSSLEMDLSRWAERAHTELRDHLDIAFNGYRWRKLGWWKLFWRVDDVSMIAAGIISRRFLTDAENEVIFLAGKIEQAGVFKNSPDPNVGGHWAYKPIEKEQRAIPLPKARDLFTPEDGKRDLKNQNWPLGIPATRNYLADDTVPALQALAQKLVFQTLTTSSLASILAGLTYASSISTGVYEAGAIAALGIVYSMRRMQGKWETARTFWEGEVREEGRKAVRSVEGMVGDVLKKAGNPLERSDPELERAGEAVEEAENALKVCK